jgi:hypothetical protein
MKLVRMVSLIIGMDRSEAGPGTDKLDESVEFCLS